MINLKRRENLGENPEVGKYQGPNSLSTKSCRGPQLARQKREIETVAYVTSISSCSRFIITLQICV